MCVCVCVKYKYTEYTPLRCSNFYLALIYHQAHFCDDRNLADMDLLREIAARHGVDAEGLVQSTTASQQLRLNTSEVVERGGFGVPR